jgi:hypothetical protein
MSNGLGAGFAAPAPPAVLAGLALLAALTALGAYAFARRAGAVPAPIRYLSVALGVGVLGVADFGAPALHDGAPPVAWLFLAVAFVPLAVVGVHLDRTTGLARVDVAATTVMAWGLPFLLGVLVALGATNGISSALGLAPAQSGGIGVPRVAAALGGVAVVLGTRPFADRLAETVRSGTESRAHD